MTTRFEYSIEWCGKLPIIVAWRWLLPVVGGQRTARPFSFSVFPRLPNSVQTLTHTKLLG